MNHEEFFKRFGHCQLQENQFPFVAFRIDELYEFFKQRLISELLVDDPHSPHFGKLIDATKAGVSQ